MLSRETLLSFCLADFQVPPSEDEVLEWFKVLKAGWVHNGNPRQCHALLHSGKHSDGFFLCKRVLKYPNLREILAKALALAFRSDSRGNHEKVDGVFGAPYSSITLAAEVGRFLGVPNYIVEKHYFQDIGNAMVFKSDDPIPEGARLLQVEELITTFDSAKATRDAIVAGNPNRVEFVPFVCTLVHRPSKMCEEYEGAKLVAIINRQVSAWDQTDCPLCKLGSVVVAPKTNWAKLTA